MELIGHWATSLPFRNHMCGSDDHRAKGVSFLCIHRCIHTSTFTPVFFIPVHSQVRLISQCQSSEEPKLTSAHRKGKGSVCDKAVELYS